jgi:hypothetical protein
MPIFVFAIFAVVFVFVVVVFVVVVVVVVVPSFLSWQTTPLYLDLLHPTLINFVAILDYFVIDFYHVDTIVINREKYKKKINWTEIQK